MLPRLLDELVWPNNWRDARRLSDDMTVRPSGDIDRRRRAVAELCGDGLNIAYCLVMWIGHDVELQAPDQHPKSFGNP